MFWDDPYQKQILKNIESLIAAKEFQKAQDLCNEVLEKDPDNAKILKLVDLIEQRVREENEEKIDAALAKLKPLWEEKNYVELIKKLHEIKEYSPEYEPLLEQITKAEKAYRNQVKAEENNSKKQIEEEFAKLFEEEKLDEIVSLCHDIEHRSFQSEEMIQYSKEMRKRLVDVQLNKKKDFIAGDKYDEILSFLEGLSNIAQDYKKLTTLIEEIKVRKVNNVSFEQQETSFKAIDDVKNLLKLEKYEEALIAAKELQVYNPTSKVVENLVIEAEEKFNKQLDQETSNQIKEEKAKMAEEREEKPDDFISL